MIFSVRIAAIFRVFCPNFFNLGQNSLALLGFDALIVFMWLRAGVFWTFGQWSQRGFPHGQFWKISAPLTHVIRSAFDAVDGSHHRHRNVCSWLKADIQSPKIDFRFTLKSGHSEAHAGLPLLTQRRHSSCNSSGIPALRRPSA